MAGTDMEGPSPLYRWAQTSALSSAMRGAYRSDGHREDMRDPRVSKLCRAGRTRIQSLPQVIAQQHIHPRFRGERLRRLRLGTLQMSSHSPRVQREDDPGYQLLQALLPFPLQVENLRIRSLRASNFLLRLRLKMDWLSHPATARRLKSRMRGDPHPGPRMRTDGSPQIPISKPSRPWHEYCRGQAWRARRAVAESFTP